MVKITGERLTLKNGESAMIVESVSEELCGYGSSEYPSGTFKGHDLLINLETGRLYALPQKICMNCAYCGKCAIWVNEGDNGTCRNFTMKDGE